MLMSGVCDAFSFIFGVWADESIELGFL